MRGQNKISFPSIWHEAGSITSEHIALAATARDVATVDALATAYTIKINPPLPGPYAMLLRFRSDGSNNDDSILQMYSARGSSDHYAFIGQLTVVQGQQLETGSIYFVDTITPATEDTIYDGEEANNTDVIAHYYLRTLANDRFIIVASDLDTTTVYCDVCWLYE